ncbi:hypothetical protein AAFF_G00384970 [Aldrovandia affinis]|uniref:Apolipoprotein F n=1 Tax=Aldrovandia affinis TaxID=143900 RepID=A0AAD7SEV4_9TELE|nr:hypothetical protein AAFF_G00384970 [Aldrovandia affinis]
MNPNLKWLIVVWLSLTNPAVSGLEDGLHRNSAVEEEEEVEGKQVSQSLLSGPPLGRVHPSVAMEGVLRLGEGSREEEDWERAALRVVTAITATLQGRAEVAPLQGNASCEELLASASLGGTSSALFPREVLGLSLVPVLGLSGCPREAQTLVLQLFEVLGVADTEDLLLEIEALIGQGRRAPATATAALPPLVRTAQAERHMQAVMFNIRQLAGTGELPRVTAAEGGDNEPGRCRGWTRVKGTSLLGDMAGEEAGIREAVRRCEDLGAGCAGVSGHRVGTGRYRVVLRRGGRVVPTANSESWIRECREPAPGGRVRRSPRENCVNKREERVYNVVEWIPAVSTLYNLGTAVYYASVNCSETAKERAILSAVDLGTDALMAVTGGTVGVAGYALGAGVKTGVKAGIKYLLNTMKHEEDLIVNQNSWTTSITVQ